MISVILTTAGRDPERAQNLQETLYCLQHQSYTDWELLIIEQSLDGNFYNRQLVCDQYHPIRDPQNRGFSPAWCRNVGARMAQGDRLLFLDADLVFGSDYLEKVAAFPSVPFLIASSFIVWSTSEQKQQYLQRRNLTGLLEQARGRYESKSGRGPVNIALCFDKKWYWEEFGGYLENFFRWGSEDGEAIYRIIRILQIEFAEVPHVEGAGVGHLYHANRDRRWDHFNREIYERCKKADPKKLWEALKAANVGNPEGPGLLRTMDSLW